MATGFVRLVVMQEFMMIDDPKTEPASDETDELEEVQEEAAEERKEGGYQ